MGLIRKAHHGKIFGQQSNTVLNTVIFGNRANSFALTSTHLHMNRKLFHLIKGDFSQIWNVCKTDNTVLPLLKQN